MGCRRMLWDVAGLLWDMLEFCCGIDMYREDCC